MSVERSETAKIAEDAGRVGRQMISAMACFAASMAIPAIVEIIGAVLEWEESCSQPLKWFLLADGTLVVAGALVALMLLCPHRKAFQDQELMLYMIKKNRGGDYEYDSELEEKIEEVEEMGKGFSSIVTSCSQFWNFVLFVAGWALWFLTSADNCAASTRNWTLGMLIVRTALPIVLCCCGSTTLFLRRERVHRLRWPR
eukprot:TRINITY_DN9921_c0_g1_i3.p1 TRINITY_DN9921_c0_g1~~TRINITY_DN9921_c0_g1_i3.p1  ORF type:complete len:229 (-),score=36.06 TRINITY_DN9921_c0_g1_i3:166-762(-)